MELVCQSKLRLDGLKTADLEKYEGLDIKDICSTGLDSAELNHCAHFVSHALDLSATNMQPCAAYAFLQ